MCYSVQTQTFSPTKQPRIVWLHSGVHVGFPVQLHGLAGGCMGAFRYIPRGRTTLLSVSCDTNSVAVEPF